MKPFNRILNQPYSVAEVGRGDKVNFDKPRKWIRNAVPKMWKVYKNDHKHFQLFWSEPNTSKFHASVIYGEYIPFSGNRLILVHTTNLLEQHTTHLNHWRTIDGYIRNSWKVMTIHYLYHLVNRAIDGRELSDSDEKELNFINNTSYVVLDELHRYSKKGIADIKMATTIMDYLLQKNLKLVLGTTATAKRIKALWEWAGTFVEQTKYTYRTTKEELMVEGWNPVPTSYIWTDSETTLKLHNDKKEIINSTSENTVIQDLHNGGHDGEFDKDEKDIYVTNRIDAGVTHYLKNHMGEVGLLMLNGMANAKHTYDKFKNIFESHGYECVVWNSEAKDKHPIYKNNEKQMLDDLFNDNHPLRFVFVNGMLQEGTNKPFKVSYQTNFNKKSPDRSIQFGARAKEAYIIIDATVMAQMQPNPYVKDILEDVLNQATTQLSSNELDKELKKMETALVVEAMRQNIINQSGKESNVELDMDELSKMFNNLIDNDGSNNGVLIDGRRAFVYGVNHKGNLIKMPLNVGNQIHRSLRQKAISALDIFGD